MSEQNAETGPTLDPEGDSFFASIMDLVAPEGADTATGAGAADAGAGDTGAGAAGGTAGASGSDAGRSADEAATGAPGAGGDSGAAAPTPGAPVAGGDADAGAAPGDGKPAAPATDDGKANAAAGGTDGASGSAAPLPAGWTVDAATLAPELGKLTTALEDKMVESHQKKALDEMRTEYANYFDAAETPARMLVGQQVPALGKEGMETIQSTQDARDWQEAVKSLLVDELRSRTTTRMESESGDLNTIHASVKLFQDNPDLIPGTKGFDRDLADRMATMLKPYEHRVEGKLHGYSIPVQPIIENLRAALVAERAAKPGGEPGKAAAATAPAAAATAATTDDDQPQAGITSKAGAASETDDLSAFWGTLGLPNLQL